MDSKQLEEITHLRSLRLTPKQIARKMGLKVAEVKEAISAQARQQEEAAMGVDGLPPLVGCYADGNSIDYLFASNERKRELGEGDGMRGLGQVVVARAIRGRYQLCVFLVDYWCLGVKDALGPRSCNRNEFASSMNQIFKNFPEGYREISLQQAQAIVLGAEEYAEHLGFKPHSDFNKSRPFLGEWDGEPKLEFGRDGKPFFISGPYDNADRIFNTIMKSVGEGNFNYMVGMPSDV